MDAVREDMAVVEVTKDDAKDREKITNVDGKFAVATPDERKNKKGLAISKHFCAAF